MSGTINLALSQQFDMDGEPLGGGLLYFFAAGTTTPQSAFQDQLLTILHPNPIVLDASGRVPMFYLADGNIKIRLTDDSGVTVIAADNLLVIGPSSGGGGGGGVDPTTVLQPGDILVRFGTGTHDGFVPCNGRTIGNGISSATERANADCQALFEYLWTTTVLGVFAGATPSRGASANGDWIANKQIVLPDLRGRTIAGMDDMGAPAAGRLTPTWFGTVATTLGNTGSTATGSVGNLESKSLATTSQLPLHTPAGSVNLNTFAINAATGAHVHGVTDPSHSHDYGYMQSTLQVGAGGSQSYAFATGSAGYHVQAPTQIAATGISVTTANSNHSHTFTGAMSFSGTAIGQASPAAFSVVQPTMVLTFYMKL